ncbi:Gti1/Pac2 family-domain-containing protein, partial [Thamnocephalis sphaerospora]
MAQLVFKQFPKRAAVTPTYIGHVETMRDALLIFEGCRKGILHPIKWRPSTSDRKKHIHSGSIFVWCESEASIRRWTDGRCWTSSRPHDNFISYYELFNDMSSRSKQDSADGDSRSDLNGKSTSRQESTADPGGLTKRSLSLKTRDGRVLHLVGYFTAADLAAGKLRRPTDDPQLSSIDVDTQLYTSTS